MKTYIRSGLAALGVAALALTVTSARADVIQDPLHGFCNGSGSGSCIDNGTNTPLGTSSEFGFYLSPGSKTGTTGILTLDILLPDTYGSTSSFSVTGINNYPSGTFSLVDSAAWTTGDLETYLGVSASPSNPIGAYLPTTQLYQSTADGFYVYQVTFSPSVTLYNSANQVYEFDAISGLGAGSYIVGFFNTGTPSSMDCPSGSPGAECATANSGALLVNGSIPPPNVPEPASLALFAAGLASLAWVLGRRRRSA